MKLWKDSPELLTDVHLDETWLEKMMSELDV